MSSEAALFDVLAARGGDRDAFARLVDGYRNVVCSITLAIARDVDASEDLAQDVFVAAWAGLGDLRSPASFLPWLRQLARHRAHEFVRTSVRRRRRAAPASDAERLVDEAAIASDRLVSEEERRALEEAIEQLSDDAREIVTLFYREGRSVRQVAMLLGLSEGAVKKRLERARTTLRESVLERFAELVRRSAPNGAFTAAVATAVALASPSTASAAAISAGSGLGTAKVAAAAGAGLAGGIAGAIAGVGGVWLGLGSLLRRAADEEERRALVKLGVRASLLVLVTVAAMCSAALLAPLGHRAAGAALFVAFYLAFAVGVTFLYGRALPRILARRHDAETANDPAAALRHHREARARLVAHVAGLVAGGLGTAFGTWLLLGG
jgi:RNA polymerase sigma factor (sigma-70 family)